MSFELTVDSDLLAAVVVLLVILSTVARLFTGPRLDKNGRQT